MLHEVDDIDDYDDDDDNDDDDDDDGMLQAGCEVHQFWPLVMIKFSMMLTI
jgi:hypothetical protein